MSISVNCHFVTYSLHILLRPAIFNDTKGIIHSRDPSGSLKNYHFESRNSKNYLKLPYDNASMSVKRIDAFRYLFQGPA
jgi:hypothetical protein